MKMKSSNPTTRYGFSIAACNARQSVVFPALDGPFTRMRDGQFIGLLDRWDVSRLPESEMQKSAPSF
jgi:hypothetical protein